MIPPKLKPGPQRSSRYRWEVMKKGDTRIGPSRESLIGAFKNYFGSRQPKARFTTRKLNNGQYMIFRTR